MGIERRLAEQHVRTSQNISQAFEDLSKLMETVSYCMIGYCKLLLIGYCILLLISYCKLLTVDRLQTCSSGVWGVYAPPKLVDTPIPPIDQTLQLKIE